MRFGHASNRTHDVLLADVAQRRFVLLTKLVRVCGLRATLHICVASDT